MSRKLKSILYSSGLLLGKMIYKNRDSKVLYYHDIHQDNDIPETPMSTPMSLFLKHIHLIKKEGFEIVDTITKSENQIMITFDDGFKGVYKNRTIFNSENLAITIFVITEKIGEKHYLNLKELKELESMGFRIQSHSHSHPDLNLLSEDELKIEMITSKKKIEDFTKREIDEICFPKGLFNDKVLDTANKYGYHKLYSSIPGSFYEKNVYNVIHRNLVQFSSDFDFNCILFGGLNIFKKRYTKQHYHEK